MKKILNLAKNTCASLIVVGAHKADLSDYLLGPNAARVVRHAKSSVYVVRWNIREIGQACRDGAIEYGLVTDQ